MTFGRLLLRLLIGGLFIGHGTQKLFGWFGGPGLRRTGQGFEQLGLQPGHRHATMAGATETAGGAMIATGTATPLAASMLTSVMLTAIDRVHGRKGLWNTAGGYEYNAVMIAALLTLAEVGPGSLSVDHARRAERRGGRWSLFALMAGAAGAAFVRLSSPPRPAPAQPAVAPERGREPERMAA